MQNKKSIVYITVMCTLYILLLIKLLKEYCRKNSKNIPMHKINLIPNYDDIM